MWVHFMEVEIGMKPGTMICICYDNITRDLPSSIGQEFATSMESVYGNRVEQEKSSLESQDNPVSFWIWLTVNCDLAVDHRHDTIAEL